MTARGIANYYAQNLGTIFTESLKPFEVEIVVAEVGAQPESDQIYRITFDGSVTDEPGFVAFGGQADQVSAALKEHYSPGMSLSEAFAAALAALSASGNGERTRRGRDAAGSRHPGPDPGSPRVPPHPRGPARRAHRREPLGAREWLRGRRPGGSPRPRKQPPARGPGTPPSGSGPATGPSAGGTDRGSGLAGGGDGTPPNPL